MRRRIPSVPAVTRPLRLTCCLLVAVATLAACRPQSPSSSAAQSQTRVSLIVTGGTVVTMDAQRRILAPGAVAIDGPRIVAVGTPEEIVRRYVAADTIPADGQVVMPGLVNTHTHAPMVLFRGLADDLALMDWLNHYIFPAEAKAVTPEFVRIGTRLAALEMIESGTTTFTDMYYFEEEVARAAREAGLRGVLGETIIGFPSPDAKTPAEGLARAERFILEFKDDPLITATVAPHAMYTLDPASLEACRDLANKYETPLITHLAETGDEVRIARERFGRSPASYLESIGLLSPSTIAAHAVHLTAEDIGILVGHGVGVSHNPESNMKLASGTAPVSNMLAAGVPVGLGTDGAASNNDLDMFDAMRVTVLLHKLVERNPKAMPAAAVLEMATLGGARAIGQSDRIGSLEPGRLADLIVVSMDSPRQTPLYNVVSHLVYVTRGDDVRTTIVNGRVLMRDRAVLSMARDEVLADARRIAADVRAAVK
ncbi:MAG: amidohydrolase [Acidobacteriota bacterium]